MGTRILFLSLLLTSAAPFSPSLYDVIWDSPSAGPGTTLGGLPTYSDAQPLGNGALTALAWANASIGGVGIMLGHQAAQSSHTELFKLGVLQFHTVPTNNHFNRLSRAVSVAQHALRMTYLMRARGGFAMFYGHNGMWRRSLLDVNGSWLEHYRDNVIVTEDLLKTLGVYTNGYSFEYMNVPTGEWVPSSLKALDSMWMRWTYGGFQVLFKYFRPIVTAKGLSRMQRIDLATMLVSYGTSPLTYPLAFLWFAVLPAAQAALLVSLVLWLPMLLCAGVMWRHHRGADRRPMLKRLGDLYAGMFLVETFILAVQTRAVVNFIAGK